MEQIPEVQLKRLEDLLEKESHIPLANKLLADNTAAKLNQTWLSKSWSNLLHSDLVEVGDELHYRRLLKDARREQIPKLKHDLEKNDYHALIMDLVDQEYQELQDHGSLDPLYLLEMACELARMKERRPAYLELLNLVKLHRLEYGTLEQLRNERPPKERAHTRYLQQLEEQGVSQETENPDPSQAVRTHFKHIRNAIDENSGMPVREAPKDGTERLHREVTRLWNEFEEHVVLKVSCRLNNSKSLKELKKHLWERQEESESIFDETVKNCEDSALLANFRKELILKRPRIRNGMATKISARPEVAERVYGILETLLAAEMNAFDFLDISVALAEARFDGAISELETALANDPALAETPAQIMHLLSTFESRCNALPPEERTKIFGRQYSMFKDH